LLYQLSYSGYAEGRYFTSLSPVLPSPGGLKIDARPWPAREDRLVAGFPGLISIGRIIRAGIVEEFSEKPFFQFFPIFLGLYHGLVIIVIHGQLGSKSPTIQVVGKRNGYWNTL
jgi:hypothetical protein